MTASNPDIQHPSELIPRLAALIHSGALSNGDRAQLRRVPLTGPLPMVFHRFVIKEIPEAFQGPRYELAWRTLLPALAQHRKNPHNPETPFGRALANAGFSERRLEAMLSAEGRALSVLVARASRRLATDGRTCHWGDIARLIIPTSDRGQAAARDRIARAFFRAERHDSTTPSKD